MAWSNDTQEEQLEEEEAMVEEVEDDDDDEGNVGIEEEDEEEEEEEVEVVAEDDGDEESEAEAEGEEEEEVEVVVEEIEKQFDDDDLFGLENEDYARTPAQSLWPIPSLSHVPAKDDKMAVNWSGQHLQKGTLSSRAPLGGAHHHHNQRKGGDLYTKEPLVAEMKLGAVGHQDETLRLRCPSLQEPCQIACYSRDRDGNVHFDDRCLRRFRRGILKETGADLNQGFETFVEKQEDVESIGFADLLACIRHSSMQLDSIHFVTFRNNLNKILGTTYNRREPWEMGVHKRHGTVYLDVHKLPELPKNETHLRSCYWGYSFERLATENPSDRRVSTGNSEKSHGMSNGSTGNDNVVNANVEYCAVIKTKLGPHRVVMGAEMDCYEDMPGGRRSYVELKTSREIDARSIETFERDKLLKFWIQSFLAGVPRIVCGFRDEAGILVHTEVMSTKEITHRVKQRHYWEGGVCLAFADRVLTWLYGSVRENEDYVLRYIPKINRLELRQIDRCPPTITEHLQCFTTQLKT